MNFKPAIRLNQIKSDGKVNIKIRVSHNRKTRYLSTNFNILPSQFDEKEGRLNKKHPNFKYINIELQKAILNYEGKTIDLNPNIEINTLLEILKFDNDSNLDFFKLTSSYIDKLKKSKQQRTSEIYQSTLNMLEAYCNKPFLDFKNIDFKYLSNLEMFLKIKGLGVNAIAVHFRNIRAIFNRAIDEGIIGLEYYPFRRFKIKKEKTIKRSLTIDQLKRLKNIELSGLEELTRDFFLLSFYLIGINLTDAYYLQSIKNERIVYKRAKTGRIYNVKVFPEALQLIEKYKGETRLLSYSDRYSNPNNFKKALNKYLKNIAAKCEIDEPLTTYYARHTWATMASQLGISKDIISHALGHGNDTVTDIYIDFDLSKVDNGNRKVIEFLTV